MTEKDLQKGIIETAHRLGWKVAHFPTSPTQRRGETVWRTSVSADGKGFPDLVLVRERVVFAELKTDRGAKSSDQLWWESDLLNAGAEFHIWRPRDYSAGAVDKVLR